MFFAVRAQVFRDSFQSLSGISKKHMACCKKYKALILKYKALVSKYMPYIFREKQPLIFNNLQRHKNNPSHPCRKHR